MQPRFEGQVVTRWLETDGEAGSVLARACWAVVAAALPALLGAWLAAGLLLVLGLLVLLPQQHRDMQLLEDFAFVDATGKRWLAKRGTVINGASTPWPFWRIADPFVGRHRLASVPHDAACRERTDDWRAVHRMFYEAMRCAGTNVAMALLLYLAVRWFGPRWTACY